MTYKGINNSNTNTITMSNIESIDKQIAELTAQRRVEKQKSALVELRQVVKGNNTAEISLACYRFTSAFRSPTRNRKVTKVEVNPSA